ncbi:hypothetical protein PBY51_020425 [Eleginops maclovinus]|uniref:E3 SUMO-protein ligase KIAA1586-like n=1 Tax=Eleginops maclovinus TaxID=56733 RepID=A0AAN8AN86_ELEMC|nr:hypothetical protein PBY51_020425 [Eleginops maclovinus]
MLGKNSGVATRLTARYPNLFTWHCMNHRLELVVSDAVDEVQAVNYFKLFLEKIHNLYSQSNKNSRELLEAAQEVGSQVLKIGRVLSMRWVASSFRSVKAVWISYEAHKRHFENAAGDQQEAAKRDKLIEAWYGEGKARNSCVTSDSCLMHCLNLQTCLSNSRPILSHS